MNSPIPGTARSRGLALTGLERGASTTCVVVSQVVAIVKNPLRGGKLTVKLMDEGWHRDRSWVLTLSSSEFVTNVPGRFRKDGLVASDDREN